MRQAPAPALSKLSLNHQRMSRSRPRPATAGRGRGPVAARNGGGEGHPDLAADYPDGVRVPLIYPMLRMRPPLLPAVAGRRRGRSICRLVSATLLRRSPALATVALRD